jgi:large subunit ribosomal protein L10
MTREEKVNIVKDLTDEFKSANAILVCDYKGMSCTDLESIREKALESSTKIKVCKNTLASLALKNADQEDVTLVDTNILVWGEDQISVCKIADNAASDFKEKFTIKTGLIEGKVADMATIGAMAKLPSRDELIGMLLSVWTAPARNMVTGLDNLRDQKEQESA